ncbi:globin family protein [Loktanella sp. D2R18]|uniref:group III truncated hemoglobin n=1 Tax=Rhodobacterales TaxID=204455 RepID=UPI000DE935DF|nr:MULTISPECIES: group III truncated hemoglobin [Rhodobacterales]MDO6590249.1 group III truncated hemoglobin [Yoonia sp. 1_MG-2023]RBW42939.1 globin family protein [Loktanella sp. D2R18]
MSMPPRFPISAEQITQVVVAFYATVRADPDLGPVFAQHVTDWPSHEEKIARFWRNAILFERSYDGNPMAAHMKSGNVRPAHFDIWLGHFDAILIQTLPPETAAAWSALAHRIGRGLRYGVMPAGGPPNLA